MKRSTQYRFIGWFFLAVAVYRMTVSGTANSDTALILAGIIFCTAELIERIDRNA